MKSVSLSKEHLSKLLKSEINFEECGSFNENLNSYYKMWKDQGQEFWLKFVISCKEILGTNTGYHTSPYNVDVIYIDLLTVLLSDNFDHVIHFIELTILIEHEYTCQISLVAKNEITELEKVNNPSEVMCKLVDMSFRLRVVGAFVRMLKAWESSQIGSDFKWKLPNYWLNSGNENEKLELFIKSKWTVNEIVNMFGCKNDNIVWLIASGPSKMDNMELAMEDQKEELVTYPQTYLDWLPKPTKPPQRVARNESEVGIVEVLEQVMEPFQQSGRIWHLIQRSIPPLLARKYHIVNVDELMKDGVDRHYMGVATWFVMWNQAFGLQFLNKIVSKHRELDVMNNVPEIQENRWKGTRFESQVVNFQKNIDLLLEKIGKTLDVESAPKPEDNAPNALTFLLEPCIIIQLPWNTVLLHQWLAAALVEVLIFEKNSLELRHWPFSNDLADCATSLITLVKQLKERIMLGFTIMSKQANLYPRIDAKHPGWIMDEVILPSVPVLHFLITGKAYNILKSIKKLACTNNSKPKVYLSKTAFEMDCTMMETFTGFCYTFFCFEDPKMLSPFPVHQCASTICQNHDLNVVIARLKSTQTEKTTSHDTIKFYSPEEIFLFQIFRENKEAILKTQSKEHVELALKIIKEFVVDPERLPGLTMGKVIEKFGTDDMKKSVAEMWGKVDIETPEELTIVYCLLYNECYVKLIGSESQLNLMSKLINLELEMLEREQIIRLTNVLGIIFKITPKAIKLDEKPPLSIEVMSRIIKDCEKKCKSQNRYWLLAQLPANWNKRVNFFCTREIKDLLLSRKAEAKDFIKSLEERIGILVFNLAKTSFIIYERRGEMFEDWQIIQYILPCLVAAYVEAINKSECSKMIRKLLRMYKFIDYLIMYYEEKYLTWELRSIPRSTLDITDMVRNSINVTYCNKISWLCMYCKNAIISILNTHVYTENRYSEEMIWFDKITNALLQWPIDIEKDLSTGHEQVFFAFISWIEYSYNFLRNFSEVCSKVYQAPLPALPDTFRDELLAEINL